MDKKQLLACFFLSTVLLHPFSEHSTCECYRILSLLYFLGEIRNLIPETTANNIRPYAVMCQVEEQCTGEEAQ